MFKKSIGDRLSAWVELRKKADNSENTLEVISEFWSSAPFTPYNKYVNQYDPASWPTPWQIIVDNIYDDFTVALMMSYSIKYTEKYKDIPVKIDTLINNNKNQIYNLVIVNNEFVLNYQPNTVISTNLIPNDLYLDNSVEIFRNK